MNNQTTTRALRGIAKRLANELTNLWDVIDKLPEGDEKEILSEAACKLHYDVINEIDAEAI